MGRSLTTEQRKERSQQLGLIVDEIDVWMLSAYTWFIDSCGYAATTLPRINGANPKTLHLHVLVNGTAPDGFVNDHDDRNKLNNTRRNLLHRTYSENVINSDRVDNANCIQLTRENRYIVYVMRHSKQHCLGTYETEIEAEEIRDAFRRKGFV